MKLARTAVVVATLVTLGTALPAAATLPAWSSAKSVALPSGAKGIPGGFLPSLTCVSVGNCEAGGSYTDASNRVEGLILTESRGVWTAPFTLTAPVGGASNPRVTVYALSCGALGNCSAAGTYENTAGDALAFYANEVRGKWSSAHRVDLPANALVKGQDAAIRSLACPSAGNCSAVGNYDDNNPVTSREEGFVDVESKGVWHRASEVTFAGSTNFDPFVSMGQVACASNGRCVAVGSYIDANDVTQGLVLDENGDAWDRGLALALPANASAFSGATLSEVTCVRDSSCAVFGSYYQRGGAIEALSASETHDTWGRAVELTMPTNADTNPHVFLYGFGGIACATRGNCSAGGQYEAGNGEYQGFLANENDGVWSEAQQLALPGGALSAGKNGGVVALACPTAGNCRASGAYLDASNHYQAVVVTETNGQWATGAKVVLPGSATSVGVDGGIYSLICASPSSCLGTGSYLEGASTYQGFTLAT
ncbi:MAG: hypothetical protein JWM55_763 [Acidimicrobiaceae bacterium]|nr:hypothetical protein [Acidimicrobiaceae bacterium]